MLAVAMISRTSPAWGLEGRYLGSLYHTDSRTQENLMSHLYDVNGYRALSAKTDLRLRMSLRYHSRPGTSNSSLLRGRFQGDLRSSIWRLNAQYEPWQRLSARGPSNPQPESAPPFVPPRQRDAQLLFQVTPPRGPSLAVNFGRQDRETVNGRFWSDNRRAQLNYSLGGFGSEVAYRRVQGTSDGANAPASLTEEVRGGLTGVRSWRTASVQAGYDALYSHFSVRERRRELHTQRVGLTAAWNPTRRFTASTSLLDRWGGGHDDAAIAPLDISEQSVNANLEFRPFNSLQFEALRQYQRSRTTLAFDIIDYLQFEARLRRDLRRGLAFQSGWLGSADLGSSAGGIPNNAAYALIDGRLRPGLETRAELRASRAATGLSTGTSWLRLLQLRTHPNRVTRFDITWRKDTLPEFLGLAQVDQQWEFVAGYEPMPGASIVGAWRRLDGFGRVARLEHLKTLNASWRWSERTSAGFNWSRRSATAPFQLENSATGLDLTLILPSDIRLHGTWSEIVQETVRIESITGLPEGFQSVMRRDHSRSYGASLEKSF